VTNDWPSMAEGACEDRDEETRRGTACCLLGSERLMLLLPLSASSLPAPDDPHAPDQLSVTSAAGGQVYTAFHTNITLAPCSSPLDIRMHTLHKIGNAL